MDFGPEKRINLVSCVTYFGGNQNFSKVQFYGFGFGCRKSLYNTAQMRQELFLILLLNALLLGCYSVLDVALIRALDNGLLLRLPKPPASVILKMQELSL